MHNVINFFVGVAIAVGSAFYGGGEKVSQKVLSEILGVSSEFLGDSVQSLIRKIAEIFSEKRETGRISGILQKNFTNGKQQEFKNIFDELNGEGKKDLRCLTDGQRRKLEKKEARANAKAVIKLSFELLFEVDLNTYLKNNSETYKNMDGESAEAFTELVKLCIKTYTKDVFIKSDRELKVASAVIVNAVRDCVDDRFEEFKKRFEETLMPFVARQDGGQFNFQRVALARYTPKYILNACPVCGYNGERIYTDEKTNETRCAACGESYSVLRNVNPDLWEEINGKCFDIFEKQGAMERALEKYNASNSVKLTEISGDIENLKNSHREDIKKGLEEFFTREFLSKCFNATEEKLDGLSDKYDVNFANIKEITEKYFKNVFERIAAQDKKSDLGIALLKEIKETAQDDRRYNAVLGGKLVSFGSQLSEIYSYLQEKLELSGQNDRLLLSCVEKLCTKDYMQELTFSLGADIRQALKLHTETNLAQFTAVNANSTAQIISYIEKLYKKCVAAGGGISEDEFSSLLRNEIRIISGSIASFKEIMSDYHAEYMSMFGEIIKQNEKIIAIEFGKVNNKNLSNLYSGRIPDGYLINDGFEGEFSCPYCAAYAEHKINSEQMCKCVACGKIYYKVKPEFLDNVSLECGIDKDNEYLPTAQNIQKWRKEHTATVENFELCAPPEFVKDKIMIIPEKYCSCGKIDIAVYKNEKNSWARSIETIIVPENIIYVNTNVFNETNALKKIIFKNKLITADNNGKDQDRIYKEILKAGNIFYGKI